MGYSSLSISASFVRVEALESVLNLVCASAKLHHDLIHEFLDDVDNCRELVDGGLKLSPHKVYHSLTCKRPGLSSSKVMPRALSGHLIIASNCQEGGFESVTTSVIETVVTRVVR